MSLELGTVFVLYILADPFFVIKHSFLEFFGLYFAGVNITCGILSIWDFQKRIFSCDVLGGKYILIKKGGYLFLFGVAIMYYTTNHSKMSSINLFNYPLL
ncbi:hypothetical protein AS005_00305 [Thermotoga sp. KOL6]|nr:hypothetical protein AS005_00305 [Thermotoga sp. KOL6]